MADQLARLQSALQSCGLEQAEGVPLIAPLLNLPVPENYPSLTYSADWQRRRLLATLVEAVRGAARAQPLVIVVEDLQWVDPSTLELLKLLLEQTAAIRVLLLFTARAEFQARWALRAHHIHTLSKLSSRDVRAMISHVALDKVLTDDTVATLVDRSGGVPLYVEELTRAVLETSLDNTNRAIPASMIH